MSKNWMLKATAKDNDQPGAYARVPLQHKQKKMELSLSLSLG
jgi:hypothetical protein